MLCFLLDRVGYSDFCRKRLVIRCGLVKDPRNSSSWLIFPLLAALPCSWLPCAWRTDDELIQRSYTVPMGTPEAGKLFLQALTGSGSTDMSEDSMFDTVALQTVTDIRAYKGRLTCIIPVQPRVQNRYGTLHGGCIGQHTCIITPVQAGPVSTHLKPSMGCGLCIPTSCPYRYLAPL